jgi:hypothetical protein
MSMTRSRRQQAASPDHVREADPTPQHRITIFSVIFVVVVVLVVSGHSVSDVLGLVTATAAAASQVSLWLSGQRPAVGSPGGVR